MQEEEGGGYTCKGDGLGYIVAGGLAVMKPMTLPQRFAAMNAARKRASIHLGFDVMGLVHRVHVAVCVWVCGHYL